MTDPVEVIARAICRVGCPCETEGRPCWDWEGSLPEAHAALSALEAGGMVVRQKSEPYTYKYDAASNEVLMFRDGVYVGNVPD
jgi:hypothetical protein